MVIFCFMDGLKSNRIYNCVIGNPIERPIFHLGEIKSMFFK